MQKKIAFLCVFIMAYTLYFIDLPPWWDGTTTAMTALDTVKNNIDLYVDFFGKPPFIFLSLGTLFKIFGYSPEMIHVFMMVFSIAGIIFTYKAGEILGGKEIACSASFLLAFSPLFIAQSVNLNFDLPSMALLMAVYYFYLKKNYVFLAIFGIMLVMTKEIGILFIAALLLSTIINYAAEKKSNNKLRDALAAQLIPIIVFVGWAYGNYTRKGWFLFPRDSPIMKLDSIFNENLIMRLEQLLVINYNWILTILIICSLLIWFYRHRQCETFDREKIKMLLPLILFSLIFFVAVAPIRDFNLPRYVIVLYPAFYLASAWAISVLSGKNRNLFAIIIISMVLLFAAQSVYSVYSQDPYVFLDPATQKIYGENPSLTLDGSGVMEINLKYVDYGKADIELVGLINTTDHSAPLLLNRFNHYSIFGAANKGIDIGYGQKSHREYKELGDFYRSPYTISYPAILVIENFNMFDLEKLYNMYNVTLLKQIQVNGVGADVYQIDKDYS
ncbi:MAG: glycosyltransferase family 39 protein [Candidatus Methanoperedens sp.]|nr:glycosyltransferase family 39 protein [Candidatus Methanoperedens sp.]